MFMIRYPVFVMGYLDFGRVLDRLDLCRILVGTSMRAFRLADILRLWARTGQANGLDGGVWTSNETPDSKCSVLSKAVQVKFYGR